MKDQVRRREFLTKAIQAAAVSAVIAGGVSQVTAKDDKSDAADAMPTRLLGKTGLKLPILGYGGAALPKSWANPLSLEDRIGLVRYAYDRGIRYFDTAGLSYMESQSILGEAPSPTALRASYYMNGEIHVHELGQPEGKPLTKGHMDFKPSWSKTGNKLVFFRRLKDDPVTVNWITAIGIINVDGTGLHMLSDGTHTDFNPTWTREGLNTPIWNRKNPATGSFFVMQSKMDNEPGQEVAISDDSHYTWAFSCLMDGRILVSSAHPTQGWGYYLMTPRVGGKPLYERIDCELAKKGLLDRISASPSETKVCFEFQTGFEYKDPGRTLYIADFDAKQRAITNVKAIANEEGKPIWYAYPRWIEGEAAVVYHSYETGKGQLYVYRLKDGSTKRVSTNAGADYRYPHGEAAPN